jgi:hypothetical protein
MTDFKCLYLWAVYEEQILLAGTHVRFLFQALQVTNYMLQSVSKRHNRFQVLIPLGSLRRTNTVSRDSRQVFVPGAASYKLHVTECFKKTWPIYLWTFYEEQILLAGTRVRFLFPLLHTFTSSNNEKLRTAKTTAISKSSLQHSLTKLINMNTMHFQWALQLRLMGKHLSLHS